MNENNSSQSFELKLSRAMMPSKPRHGFKEELRFQLIQHAARYDSPENHPRKQINRRWVLTFIAFVIVLASLLSLTNPKIANAMQRLFKFLPGIGVVDISQFKVLAEEVIVERDGCSVSVSGAAVDTERTRILLNVEGPSYEFNWGDFEDDSPATRADDPFLILPDNSIVMVESAMHHGDGSGRKYIHRLTFSPLPEDVMEVTLVIPRILPYPPGAVSEDWLIPITFKAGDPDTLNPVFEIGEEEEEYSIERKLEKENDSNDKREDSTSPADDNIFGVKFSLVRVAELDDGYIFMTKTTWESEDILPYGVISDLNSVTDANGELLTWDYAAADQMPDIDEKVNCNAFKVNRKDIAWPLTLKANIIANISMDTSFLFEVREEPQIGQSWQPDVEVSIPPYSLRVILVEAISDNHGGAGYKFTMESDDIFSVMLVDMINPRGGAGGGGGGGGGGLLERPFIFTSTINYFELPKGDIDVSIASAQVQLEGAWQITWQPE